MAEELSLYDHTGHQPDYKKLQKEAHLGDGQDDITPDAEALHEGPGGDEGPFHLHAKFLRYITEWSQVIHLVGDTLQVVRRQVVLRVHQLEHLLHQRRKEVVERVEQVDVASLVVAAKVAEQVCEDGRVLLVQQAVGLDEHLVEVLLRVVEQLCEEGCRRQNREEMSMRAVWYLPHETHSFIYVTLIQLPTFSLICLLSHSFVYFLTHSFTYLLSHSFTYFLTHILCHSHTFSLTYFLTHIILSHSFICLLSHSLIYLLSHSLI